MDPGGVQPRPDSALSERYTYMSKLKDKPKETSLDSNPPTYEEHVMRRTGQSTPSPTNTSLSLGQGAPDGKVMLQEDHQGRGTESEEEGYLKPTSSRKTAAVKPAPRVDGGTQMEMTMLHNPAHVGRQEEAGQNLGQHDTTMSMMPGQDNLRAGQFQPVPMGLLLRDRQGVPNNTPAAPDGHLILQGPRDRRSVTLQGLENVAYHQYEELPHREVDVGGVVLGVRGQGGGSDGPQESPYAQIGDLERTSKRKPNPLYVSGRPARRRSIEKGSGGVCGRCQDQWRGYLIPVLLFLFCVVALLLALLALTNAVSRQGAADQGADPGGTAAQTGDIWNTTVLTSQLAAALDRIQHLEMQNQQLVAQLSVLDNQTMVRQDELQNRLTELERKQNVSLQNLSYAVGRQDEVVQKQTVSSN
ncbi:Hypp2447 [Branchiostoma lanceolatum]|uniref:Hypp2447 protein n=1 Tax=Branchiostoma lanceolatum TaxID=7740 RepID=A0A8J9ZTC2_BRALA|nr:Hypp2447 [Branchiostoma lanceolatum]